MAAGDSVKHGNFTFTETSIEGVLVVDVTAYGDERGYFVETYKRPDFVAGGIDCEFVQDNQSSSVKGVLRGLHFQIEHPQSKLLSAWCRARCSTWPSTCARTAPPTENGRARCCRRRTAASSSVPRGFAHGFLVLSDVAEFCYKCDDVYHPNDEGGLMWNDPEIGIEWPILEGMELVLSEKDKAHPGLKGSRRAYENQESCPAQRRRQKVTPVSASLALPDVTPPLRRRLKTAHRFRPFGPKAVRSRFGCCRGVGVPLARRCHVVRQSRAARRGRTLVRDALACREAETGSLASTTASVRPCALLCVARTSGRSIVCAFRWSCVRRMASRGYGASPPSLRSSGDLSLRFSAWDGVGQCASKRSSIFFEDQCIPDGSCGRRRSPSDGGFGSRSRCDGRARS